MHILKWRQILRIYLEYRGNFCPEIGNTGIISVCANLTNGVIERINTFSLDFQLPPLFLLSTPLILVIIRTVDFIHSACFLYRYVDIFEWPEGGNSEYGWGAGTCVEPTPLMFIIAKKDSDPWSSAVKYWHNVIITRSPPPPKRNWTPISWVLRIYVELCCLKKWVCYALTENVSDSAHYQKASHVRTFTFKRICS